MNEIVYSWSRLNTYALAEKGEGCFLSYHRRYNLEDRGESNFFAEYGLLLHETIEKLHKNEISKENVHKVLTKGLYNFNYEPPFSTMHESYKNALRNFFNDFDDIFKDYTVLEAEEEQLFEVDGIKLKGFPDLVAEHKKYGFIIGDYKTAKPYVGEKLKHNIMQLYLYSIPIYEKYGKYPDNLVYIFSRENDKQNREQVFKFDLNDLERTKQFVRDTVKKIESHGMEWSPRCKLVDGEKDFFACFICNHRNDCKYRDYYKKKRRSFGELIF